MWRWTQTYKINISLCFLSSNNKSINAFFSGQNVEKQTILLKMALFDPISGPINPLKHIADVWANVEVFHIDRLILFFRQLQRQLILLVAIYPTFFKNDPFLHL